MQDLFVPNDYDLAARMSEQELKALLHVVQTMSFFTKVLDAMPELVGVMTPTRQIVFANKTMLVFLDLESGALLHGPRPGELVGCINSAITPGGCGTAPACKQCGALRTIMDAITSGHRASGECRITCQHEHGKQSLDLFICCAPFQTQGLSFNLLMAQDISDAKRRSALERVFFHDVLNLVNHVAGFAALLQDADPENVKELASVLAHAARALTEEVMAQSDLVKAEDRELAVRKDWADPLQMLQELAEFFRAHYPLRAGDLAVSCDAALEQFKTDAVLVKRVLRNMVKNALEATNPGDRVTLACRKDKDQAVFSVHNPGLMDMAVQHQVFQRYFSTKGMGRGLGTYSMRLLTENYLGGAVEFSSTPEKGTTFSARLPLT